MLTKNVALVSLTKKVTPSDLAKTSAALQKQATRDFGPIWGIQATVDSFPDLKSVPLGYWPIIISEDIHQSGAAGFHTDKHHQPYSLVQYDNSWQLTCSHELLEMLADPYGNRLVASKSIKEGQGKVNYLVEVCDPCEDASFAYSINGILVSDFYTPNYFDPQKVNGVRYSFTGSLTEPREIKKNGYLSWQDPISKQWFQATFFGPQLVVKNLQGMQDFGTSLRSQIDKLTINPNHATEYKKAEATHAAYRLNVEDADSAGGADWEEEIAKFIGK